MATRADTIGPRAPLRTSAVAFAVASMLLMSVGWITVRQMAHLRAATSEVEHTLMVRVEAVEVLSLLKDAETGQRGFLITGAPAYLDPYRKALAALSSRIERLRRLTGDNATQRANIARLDALVQQKVQELQETVAVRERDGFEPAARAVETGTGKRVMDEARATVEAIDAEENRLLARRRAAQEQEGRYALFTSLGSIAAAIALLGAAALSMERAIGERERERAARSTAEAVAAAVQTSAERLRVTIASICDGVIATDERGCITQLNPVAEALTGWTEADAQGRPIHEVFVIINEESQQPVENPVRKVLSDGRIASLARYTLLISKDGSPIPIDDGAAPIMLADGRMVGVVLVFRDITERRQAEREIEKVNEQLAVRMHQRQQSEEAARHARREAEHANRLKDEFLAMVSHELRTPLNAVLGWADMLRRGVVQDERRERAVSAIYVNAKRQERLIAELLDVSRIMSGKLQLERTAVDLPEVVGSAIEVVQSSADAKRIQIVVEADRLPGPFYADASRLQQVLWNLLSNAVKFTPDGGAVLVRVRRDDSFVEIVITDTGQGIPATFLPSVFEPFEQADRSTTRQHGGLGLGLSIVRHLVEAHGGTVGAESAGEGQGSTFVVRLPIVSVDADQPDSGTVTQGPESSLSGPGQDMVLQGVRVLVVDDDQDSRELLAMTLESQGAVVLAVASASEALDALRTETVDILLSDLAMPRQDGYALIRGIRARETPDMRPLPAVALTSFARDEDREKAAMAGFQIHLTKPMDSRLLVESIAGLVDRMPLS